ncbi:cytochrome c class I [Flavobacterium limnosediminis JC2902]|uniref:Cytochrome c class I n=1 Tax=Flavobacterium limnosediminis JC2902 TaxID=1341181 RepID=V6SP32_9FLAO|nr:cytochrome c class I [Flavobacterium limnosediminis]ESU28468.1 cytochrome c class I [Flavobacterium limnosediminis JC2902]
MKKIILTLSAALIITSCAVKLVTPTQPDVDRMQSKYPDYTLEELNQGKAMYEQHCVECHKLKNPTKFTETQWQKIVPGMVKKVNKKHPNAIDEKNQELILKYVITMNGHKK